MPNTSHTSLPLKGMVQDLHLLNQGEQLYTFALNAMVEDFSQGNGYFLQNEPSTVCSVEFPPDYQVVGFREIPEQNRTVYFLKNPITGGCQIGEVIQCTPYNSTDIVKEVYCKDCTTFVGEESIFLENKKETCYCSYRMITSSPCLKFDINYPVDIEYKITNCSLNLYFTDNINERRFVYFDYTDNDLTKPLLLQDKFKYQLYEVGSCEKPIYEQEIDCDKIKVHPNYNIPCIKFLGFVNGGNLKAGTYQVLISYSDVYGNPTSSYFPGSHIIPLFEKELTFETNYQTSKGLHFSIEGLKNDSIFQYYNLVIAQTIDGFTEFIHVGTYNTTQQTYVYTGHETRLKRLDSTEVFFKRPYYKTSKAVTKANDYLFNTGVTEYPILNLQPIVNRVNFYWETVAIKEGAYFNPRNTFLYKTFMRDEVYALGLEFVSNNGRVTCRFHVPGRSVTPVDEELINNNDDIITEDLCTDKPVVTFKPKWQVYNTASVIGTPHEYSEDCVDSKCWEWGEFGYWESTESYPEVPEVWGDLCGKKIRHHKFPDSVISHIHDKRDVSQESIKFADDNVIYPIGIRIDHQSVKDALQWGFENGLITQEQKDDIVGYRIVRGNRVGNKSIQAKGLLFNMFKDNSHTDTYFSNYPYNDTRSSDSYLNNVIRSTNDMFTFHSPDIHFVNSSIGNVLKLETEEFGKTESYFTHSECQARHKFLSGFAYTMALGLGIAAAISATGEKQCKVIEYQAPSTVDTPEVVTKKEEVYSNVSSSSFTVMGVSVERLKTDPGKVDAVDKQQPYTTTTIYNKEDAMGYNDCGEEKPITGTDGEIKKRSKETITTCKGNTWQIFKCPDNVDSEFLKIVSGLLNTLGDTGSLIAQRTVLGYIEMDKVLSALKTLIPYWNYNIQHNSAGKYLGYSVVKNEGFKVRKILKHSYLTPNIQTVDTTINNIYINNWNRESSLFIKTENVFNDLSHVDNSKTSMRDVFGKGESSLNKLDVKFSRDICSYYGSIKTNVSDQYGKICNIDYLETNSCVFDLRKDYNYCDSKVFGGDIFITRFALKRKMPFFTHTLCKLPDGSDVEYSKLGNVGVPKYFFNTPDSVFDYAKNVLGVTDNPFTISPTHHEYDVFDDVSLLDFIKPNFYQKGYIDLFCYGVPYFLVESDINVDYRHGQNNTDKDFYPHTTDLKKWFEEDYVPISTDNYFFYNRTYSKQNHESVGCNSCILDIKDLICQSTNYNRLIHSEPTSTENNHDNWLTFKANSYYDFPLTLGRLITADGIENDKVLVRLEKGVQIFNAYNTIQATGANIQVGTGGMFQSRPQDIAVTELGYAGTQHRDILHTEFGHVWADAERGQVFNLGLNGNGLEEISKAGMRSWFKENLSFNITKCFPEYNNIDNNLNDIGLHYGFDKRFGRMFITKLDYKCLNNDVTYNPILNEFSINNVKIELWNPAYFCNKSWTISYTFATKSWTSFHSCIPNLYIEHIDIFNTGVFQKKVDGGKLGKVQKLYTHNFNNKSYQVVYGKLEPFIVEYQTKQNLGNNFLRSVEYYLDVIRYHNEFDTFYNRTKTFNKAIIYNDRQTSGLLHFKVSNPEDLTELEYPKRIADGYEILTSNSENVWRFNDFWDVSRSQLNNLPLFNYDCNNVNKHLNSKAINYDTPDFDRNIIKQRMCRVRLIQDVYSNYKYVFCFANNIQSQSYR